MKTPQADLDHIVMANSGDTLGIQICLHCGRVKTYMPGITLAEFPKQMSYFAKKHATCRDRKPEIATTYRLAVLAKANA